MKRVEEQSATLVDWWHQQQGQKSSSAELSALCERLGALESDYTIDGAVRSPRHLLQALALLDMLHLDPASKEAYLRIHAHRVAGDDVELPDPSALAKRLVAGFNRAGQLEAVRATASDAGAAEGLRRLLLALVEDVRVILLKLVDHVVILRAMAEGPEELREYYARESTILHGPLANRLGVWQLKWELEDLAFRYLQPDTYKRIAKMLAERREQREVYIANVINQLREDLAAAGVRGEVAGRPKHIYSIWRKLQRKDFDFDQLYDLRAVRIIVDSVADCYAVLGLVHGRWRHIPQEFDDYIATPKANNYQSLHTAVIGPEGKPLEIQIRTHAMHEHAELGVAAHWRYKEGGGDPDFDQRIATIRQMFDGQGDGDEDWRNEALLESLSGDEQEQRVYALTPQGRVIDLPVGATVLDFAYHVHTDVGHRCRGAKVNGRIAPLTQAVRTGERIEVLTAKQAAPSRDWLSPHSGYLQSVRARQKVRQWFRQQDKDANREQGREALQQELNRHGLQQDADLQALLKRFNLQSVDALEIAVGRGEITPAQVARAVEERSDPGRFQPKWLRRELPARPPESGDGDITIEGVGNLMTRLAPCCNPLPGDDIIGYVTRGRGVTVHRRDCGNAANLLAEESPRLIDVSWGRRGEQDYAAELEIRALDRKHLLKDVSTVLSNAQAQIMALHSDVDPDSGEALMNAGVQVTDVERLSELMDRLRQLPNVTSVRRITSH